MHRIRRRRDGFPAGITNMNKTTAFLTSVPTEALVREIRLRGCIAAVLTPQDILNEHESYDHGMAFQTLATASRQGIEDDMMEHAMRLLGFRSGQDDEGPTDTHYGEEIYGEMPYGEAA